jgi:hypothetical protein
MQDNVSIYGVAEEKGVGAKRKKKVRKLWILESKWEAPPSWMRQNFWNHWRVHGRYVTEKSARDAITDLKKKLLPWKAEYRIIPPEVDK